MLEANRKTVSRIESRYYFKPINQIFEKKVKEVGRIKALDTLTDVMQNAKGEVNRIIQQRKNNGFIKDADQARKTVAGNALQGLIAYSLIELQREGKLDPDLVITLKPKSHPLIEKYAEIKVGDEVQKPDIDILIYKHDRPEEYPITIYSIKTSLRERAGQTYKWKLLMDIATSENCQTIKDKYELNYEAGGNFKVGLVTTNFYDEIKTPQQRGMLKFFDFVYITKDGDWEKPILKFSEVVNDLNTIYR